MNRPASTHQTIPRHSAMCHLLAWAIPAASWLAALSVMNANEALPHIYGHLPEPCQRLPALA